MRFRPSPWIRARPGVAPALALGAAFALSGCGDDPVPPAGQPIGADPCAASPPDDTPTPPIHTPRWAFEPWISKDISTTADVRGFVGGFRDRDIPVGVVVIDSPWETHYNTFVPNPSRYPDFEPLVTDLSADGVRVVLWITQMVNTAAFDLEMGGDIYAGPSPNFEEGLACGFFVDDGTTYGWWKGVGAGVDFLNPRAAGWWHRQQDSLLDLGIAGWKLDFGDSYVRSDPVKTAAGPVPHQQYSEEYYRDSLAYGVSRRGPEEFVTMVRPWDESYDFSGRFFARREHAPVAWVGDNRRDWVGLSDALDHIFRSAEAGYVVLGSDIGGYLDRDDKTFVDVPFDLDAFSRWTALGALTPFMELHGRANLTPWTVPEDPDGTVALYRYWATLHHELVPFFYSLAEEAYAAGGPILHPQGEASAWPGDYRFLVGDALLVAPILAGGGKRDVALPSGAKWYDWWSPSADALEGAQTIAPYDAADRARIPLFVRQGAIIPAAVESALTGLGTSASAGALTVLVYPGPASAAFTLHDDDGTTTRIAAGFTPSGVMVELSRALAPVILRVRADSPPIAVSVDGDELPAHATRAAFDAAEEGWLDDGPLRSIWVKLPASPSARQITLAAP